MKKSEQRKLHRHRRTRSNLGYSRRLRVEFLEDRRLLAASFFDINPNNSNLDTAGNPNGASGGRFNGLASVPGTNQTFYGASEWGGLYKTIDGGNTWTFLHDHLPTATWDVEVDPSNANIVYASSFYDGRVISSAGIQVSRDAGATWINPLSAHVNPGFDNTPQTEFPLTTAPELSAFGIGIRPGAPNNVFVGTNAGLARSTDSGLTWTFVDPFIQTLGATGTGIGGVSTIVWDVLVQATGIIDVITSRGHFRSTDGANSWTTNNIPNAAFSATQPSTIAASPDESYVLYVSGANNRIWESTDAGATAGNWRNLGTPDPSPQGRIPFVETNQRSDQGGNNIFDLWFGDVRLFRGRGTTPAAPAIGGASRMQPVNLFAGDLSLPAGAHVDAGDIVFDRTVATDASPRIYSSDGGVYRNTNNSADTPAWEQPTVTPHATWLFAMTGVVQPGQNAEDIYFGLQDDGNWSSINAGSNAVTWNNGQSADGFDVVADANQVIVSNGSYSVMGNRLYGGFLLFRGDRNLQNLREFNNFNYPGGNPPAVNNNLPAGTASLAANFQYIDTIAQFGPSSYVLVTDNGVFFTTNLTMANINAGTVTWTPLGAATTPAGATGVKVAMAGGTPTFFVQVGGSSNNGNQLWSFTGTGAGNWARIDNQGGQTGGVGIFAVDPNNPNRIYASNFAPAGLRMVFSNDGGTTWNPDPELDLLMTGGGAFQYQTTIGPTEFTGFNGYAQPTLLAFDPNNGNNLVAGGHDSGIFFSNNGGNSWRLLTDPYGTVDDPLTPADDVPHLPRPRFAHFNDENAGAPQIYIGTVGRGVWRINIVANAFDLPQDRFEPNDTIGTSTVLGSLQKITERDLTIHNATDVDFFQYTAQDTGKLIVNTFFDLTGDLDLRVRDARGNQIAIGTQTNVGDGRVSENLVIPVVSQQRYFIEIFSGAQHTNTYDLEIENFPAPIPNAVALDPADDNGISNNDNITSDTTPTIFVQADLSDFANTGITILSAAQAAAGQTAGAAVQIFRNGVAQGFADVLAGSDNTLFNFEFSVGGLVPGLNFITAAVRMFDGQRNAAGNPAPVSGRTQLSEPLLLRRVVDDAGPRITNVTRGQISRENVFSFDGVTSLFDPKPSENGPDSLVHSIMIHFSDLSDRTAATANVHALREALANEEGNYSLRGDHNGFISIVDVDVTFITIPNDGLPETATVELVFDRPLPDDRYSLWVSDSITDPAGNALDGESGAAGPFDGNDVPNETPPIFPTGDGAPGGDFHGRFTIDSRPEIGTYALGTVYLDINGNFVFDPQGEDNDQVNRDLVFLFGEPDDKLFAGNFAPQGAVVASGYDKLAAYGKRDDGHWGGSSGESLGESYDDDWYWLFDFDHNGTVDLEVKSGKQTEGDPAAGNFDLAILGVDSHPGDEIALFDDGKWYLDTSGNNNIGNTGDTTLYGDMRGLPIVGDFDGDGLDDLATWNPGDEYGDTKGEFQFDLAYNGLTGVVEKTIEFDLSGSCVIPVAADMNSDGIDDVGLFVTDREGVPPSEAAEWFFLISDNPTPTPGAVTALDHPFSPFPLGTDLFAQYGDKPSLPIVGNFDPPAGNSPSPELPGDYNQDDSVDAADYVFWRKIYGTSVAPYSGPDGDGDTSIDEDDYDVWSSKFGQTAPLGVESGAGPSLSIDFAYSQNATDDSLTQEPMPAADSAAAVGLSLPSDASIPADQAILAATKSIDFAYSQNATNDSLTQEPMLAADSAAAVGQSLPSYVSIPTDQAILVATKSLRVTSSAHASLSLNQDLLVGKKIAAHDRALSSWSVAFRAKADLNHLQRRERLLSEFADPKALPSRTTTDDGGDETGGIDAFFTVFTDKCSDELKRGDIALSG